MLPPALEVFQSLIFHDLWKSLEFLIVLFRWEWDLNYSVIREKAMDVYILINKNWDEIEVLEKAKRKKNPIISISHICIT